MKSKKASILVPMAVVVAATAGLILAIPQAPKPTAPATSLLASGSPAVYPTSTQAVKVHVAQQAPAQPTATPQPTDTPIPAPTVTPAPTWHAVGTFSGSAQGLITTLTGVSGPFRMDWTCQVSGSLPTWDVGFEIVNTADSGKAEGAMATCDASTLSGTLDFADVGLLRGDWSVEAWCGSASCQMGNWTATVYEWS